MGGRQLSYEQTAALLRVSVSTLRNWMKANSFNSASDMAVELLCLKTGWNLPPWLA